MVQYHDVYYFLYPPPPVAAVAARLVGAPYLGGLAGRGAPMPEERLHITLQPLGRFADRIPRAVLDLALAVGETVDEPPFDLTLDLLQSRGGAGFGGTLELAGRGPAVRELRRFQRGLGNTMRHMGFPADQIRAGFSPHMTLDYAHRHVARQAIVPIAWAVTQFFLVDSLYGQGRHEVLARWPLQVRQQEFSGW